MKIKVTESNLNTIRGYLNLVNGKASVHTATAMEILHDVGYAEKHLTDLGVPKKLRRGAQLSCRSGQKVPVSYKYTRIVNAYGLVRGSRHWFLTSLTKRDAWGDRGWANVVLTPKQDEIAVSHLRKTYQVDKPVTLVTPLNEENTPLNPS